MWRYWVGGGAALVLALAGMFLFRGSAAPGAKAPAPPAQQSAGASDASLPAEAPSADARTREQKRFDRLDKDRNQAISRDEFFALRKRLFAKMDADRDGKLSFDEWSYRGIERFTGADKDRSGALNRTEFAATAPKRRPARPACRCEAPKPKGARAAQAPAADGEEE